MSYNIFESFSYNASEFKLVGEDTIAYLQGDYCILRDLGKDTQKKDYIKSTKNGFQCFTTIPSQNKIYLADYSLQPNILVYNALTKKKLENETIKGASDLEILQMDISIDGNRLLIVRGVPHYDIILWDLKSNKRMKGQNFNIKLGQKFIKASFCPGNTNLFAVLYESVLNVYQIVTQYELSNQGGEDQSEEEFTKNYRYTLTQFPSEQSKMSNFIWDEQNHIYLAENYSIKYFYGTDLQQVLTKDCEYPASIMVVTPKHLIIVLSNGRFEWVYKYDSEQQEEFKPFSLDKSYTHDEEKIKYLLFNQRYEKLFAGTEEGSIIIFDQKAEKFDNEEEEGDGEKEAEKSDDEEKSKEFVLEYKKHGPYPVSKIVFIREFQEYNIAVTVSQNGGIYFWDIQKKEQISSLRLNCEITSGEIDAYENLLFLGSSQGVIRVLDITDLKNIKIIRHIKLFKKKEITSLRFNGEQNLLAVSSLQSRKVFFLRVQSSDQVNYDISVSGYCKVHDYVHEIAWATGQGSKNNKNLIVLIHYYLLALTPPDVYERYENLNLTDEVCQIYGRKIDPQLYHLIVNPSNGDILCTGEDKLLKKYKQPDELFSKLDHTLLVGFPPTEEQEGHPLPINHIQIGRDGNQLVSGSQDGSVQVRNINHLNQIQSFKAHNIKTNGVSYVHQSRKYNLIYTGGNDGSIIIFSPENVNVPNVKPRPSGPTEHLNQNFFDNKDEAVLHYHEVLQREFVESQKQIREQQKQAIMNKLKDISSQLNQLLQNNRQCEELERLDRDEFVIDFETRDQILQLGQSQCNEIRQNAKRNNVKMEILFQRLKKQTWDEMEEQLVAINGLDNNILVYNFHIRKRSAQELKLLQRVKHFRLIEMKEIQHRRESKDGPKISELITLEQFSKNQTSLEYIINNTNKKPQYVLVDYEAKEEQKMQEQSKSQNAGGGLLGQQRQGAAIGGRAAGGKKDDKKTQEEQDKEAEEKKKKEEEEKKKLEEQKQGEQGGGAAVKVDEWDYLYSAMDLFTNNRKRSQMVLIQNIIFQIKKEFNQEFNQVQSFRQSSLDQLNERNKRIEEILTELKKENDVFVAKKNILENPEERIIKVDPKRDIPFEKFLTREEKKKIEEERRKEEQRLRDLMADDAGVRAVKQMMGGTLEEKKENPLDEGIEKEEWMDKPVEEMNEEERLKLKEYEVKKAKLNEEKEKIRNNLENELKKLRSSVTEICQKFDQRLMILFRRRLEYEYRILEQELYIVRLALQIVVQKSSQADKQLYLSSVETLDQGRQTLDEIVSRLEQLHENLHQESEAKKRELDAPFNVNNTANSPDGAQLKKLWLQIFGEDGKKIDDKRKADIEKRISSNPNYQKYLFALDPLEKIQLSELRKILEQDFEFYQDEIREKLRAQQINDEQLISHYEAHLRNKFEKKQRREELESRVKEIEESLKQYRDELQESNERYNFNLRNLDQLEREIAKSNSNIELIFRFKQGLVEIPYEKPVPDLKNAILIERELIEIKNSEINKQGEEKIGLMEDIKKIKYEVEDSQYQLKKKELQIEKIEYQTKEVQLLKVKKEMQEILVKKDMKLVDLELSQIQTQISSLITTTDKRVQIFKKKEDKIIEQIEYIKKENEQLSIQEYNLKDNVLQREKIDEIKKKNVKVDGEQGDDKEDGSRFQQIAINRKLFDLAKRQTEEIELLREELNKLKARTFANFSVVQR